MFSLGWLRSRGLWASVSAIGLLAACMHAGEKGKVVAGGTLSLPREGAAAEKPDGPLKVAFGSPTGDVGIVTEVSIVFDRPVQPLGVVPTGAAPFRVTPEVRGSFHWVGSRAVVFTPERRFAFATRFRVEVPAGLRALDGTQLQQAYSFEFETPRPAKVSTLPYEGERGKGLDTKLELELNQEVRPEALKAAAKLEASGPSGKRSLLFDVVAGKEPRKLLVKPQRPLPPASEIALKLSGSLRGVEGPLDAGAASKVTFWTYEPLALNEASCARSRDQDPCEPDSSVSLVFNNSVRPRDVMSKVRVTPEVGLRALPPSEGEELTSYVPLVGHFQAGQTYKIQVDAGVVDEFGQNLQKPATRTLRFRDHYPRVDIGAVGRNFDAQPLSVPVASRNVAGFELLTAPLSPADLLGYVQLQRAGNEQRDGLDWLGKLRSTQVQRISPRSPKNQIEKMWVDASKVLGKSGKGALAIAARYRAEAGDYGAPPALKVLNVSNLGVSAKLSRFGSLVWVTQRSTNVPAPGAQVSIFVPGRPELTYTTDQEGLVRIPAADLDPRLEQQGDETRAIVVVRLGDDSAFAPLGEYIDSWRLDVPSDFSGRLRAYGVAFTDRGIYRPGDEVKVKGIVRQQTPTGNALPPQKALDVVLRSPSGEDVLKQSTLLTEHGTFATTLALPRSAELGQYSVSVSGLEGNRPVVEQSLEVAEYRPAELKVEAATDKTSYLRLESAELELRSSYLFGAAGAGLDATVSVSRQPTWYEVPGADGFATDGSAFYADIAETSPAGELRRESKKLDAQGRLRWSEKLNFPGQRGPELLRVDAEVTDQARRSVATSTSAIVHPGSFYVGVRTEQSFIEAPGSVKPQVLALSPSGKRLPGKRVTLQLIERRYSFARESAGDDYRSYGKPIDKKVAECQVTTTTEPATCPLTVPAAGYYLVAASATDERNNALLSAASIYATGPGEPTWQDNDRRSLELVLDKKSYSVGERARILVKSPYKEAEALITIERSGVYQAFRRTLRGTAPSFEVPVVGEYLPNVFVAVHLLPKRSGKGPLLDAGSYRIGYANVVVSGEARRLSLAITPNARDYRPGQNIEVKLAVKDARGAAAAGAEVTLYSADEGVLSLIDYRTPDPLQTFASPRPLQVATLESRDAEGKILLESLGSGRDKGRDGGGGGEGEARRDFRQTAYFNPRIIVDARGEAKVTFKLPESLTTHRLMAVAVTKDDRYGFAQERVTTSKPLMARPALPRFLRAGDAFEAGVVVSKKGLGAGKVKVSVSATGLEITGAREREVEVPQNGSLEVRFPARAPHPGQASVRFEVAAGAEKDAAVLNFPVAVPMTPEVAALYGQTRGAQREQLGVLSEARDDVGGLTVSLASTALVGVDQVALDLLEYPYSCTEQLSSRLVPLVSLGELAKVLGFSPPADAKRRADDAVGEILVRQQGDGGFAMWPESGKSSEWISPYATLALLRAQQFGVKIPRATFERARAYLRQLADISAKEPHELPNAALALDVLGELGSPDAGGINKLFERRAELPLHGQALLLHAAIKAKLGSNVTEELLRVLEASLHVNGDRALVAEEPDDGYGFSSQSTTQAQLLRALSATGKHALLTQVARGLIGSRKQGRFRTTHEGAWALLALTDYRRVAEPETPKFEASVSLGAKTLATKAFDRASPAPQKFELPFTELLARAGEPLVFEKEGAGQLFYEARLRYVRRELPSTPLDAGFYVEKKLYSLGKPAGLAREVAAGDTVMVDLSVVVPGPREYVVVDDPLPAGLEAIDPRLSTTADWLRLSGYEAQGEGAASGYGRPYDRSEVRDDRVVFFADQLPPGLYHFRYLARATTYGEYVLPPTRVEEMYEPEVFGRTGAAQIRVR